MSEPTLRSIDGPVVALVGPTAIGKTAMALTLATEFGGEIVSVDSMQVYRHMDIGTAKASPAERRLVPHHLLDLVDPDEQYHAGRFIQDCLAAIDDIHRRGSIPLLTGGTGLYLHALRHGLFAAPPIDPAVRKKMQRRLDKEGSTALHRELRAVDPVTAERVHVNDRSRIVRALELYHSSGMTVTACIEDQRRRQGGVDFSRYVAVGLTCSREKLYRRIDRRTELLLEAGLEDEVRGLLAMGYGPELKPMQAIGYRHVIRYLEGDWAREEAVARLARDTRRYAKRQCTWFNRDETIAWFDRDRTDELISHIRSRIRI